MENLNEVDDYTFWIEKEDDEYNYDQPYALPGSVDHSIGKQSTYVDIVASSFDLNLKFDSLFLLVKHNDHRSLLSLIWLLTNS